MATNNPIPPNVRVEVWNLLRQFKDLQIPLVFGLHVPLNTILEHLLGYDRGAAAPGA
jgi:hypothetical protein